jgi:hypothetical protein
LDQWDEAAWTWLSSSLIAEPILIGIGSYLNTLLYPTKAVILYSLVPTIRQRYQIRDDSCFSLIIFEGDGGNFDGQKHWWHINEPGSQRACPRAALSRLLPAGQFSFSLLKEIAQEDTRSQALWKKIHPLNCPP